MENVVVSLLGRDGVWQERGETRGKTTSTRWRRTRVTFDKPQSVRFRKRKSKIFLFRHMTYSTRNEEKEKFSSRFGVVVEPHAMLARRLIARLHALDPSKREEKTGIEPPRRL